MIIYENIKRAASEQIGIKACSLIHLQKIGMDTPEWFALGADCFFDFIYDHREEYHNLIHRYSEEKRQKFIKSLERTEFSDETKAKIINAIHKHFAPEDTLAIRTSITDADIDAPYIGMFETYLFVKQNDKFFTYLKKCYLSCFSKKAMEYRAENNLLSRSLGAAIIIQKMVDPDYSGIIFTSNPYTGNTDETLITITNGVSHRNTLGPDNSSDIIIDKSGKIKTDLSRTKIHVSTDLIQELQNIGQIIENSFDPRVGHDIEFVVKGDHIYIMQSRPIAAYVQIDKNKPHTILDSTMINVGLRGPTTPLTYTLTRSTFDKVQHQLLQIHHVVEAELSTAEYHIDRSICFYQNCIYLRQNNFQKIAELYDVDKPKIIKKLQHLRDKKAQSLSKLKVEDELFDEKFNTVIKPYIGNSFHGYTNIQLVETYHDLENEMLADFIAQITSSQRIKANYDRLLYLAETAKIYDAENRLNKILFAQNLYENPEKTAAFASIIKEIKRDQRLVDLFIQTDTPTLIEKLHSNSLLIFSKINSYLNEYGAFGKDELKLEAITLKDDPTSLLDTIKVQLADNYIAKAKDIVRVSEEAFIEKFRNIQKSEIKNLIETTKYLVQNRAKLHDKQVRLRNIIRALYLRIGRNFAAASIINDARDIFFLEQAEIFAIIEKGRLTNDEIQDRIAERKATYAENIKLPFYPRIHFFGAIAPENMIVFSDENYSPQASNSSESDSSLLDSKVSNTSFSSSSI